MLLKHLEAATQSEILLFLLAVFHTFTGLQGASVHLFEGGGGWQLSHGKKPLMRVALRTQTAQIRILCFSSSLGC